MRTSSSATDRSTREFFHRLFRRFGECGYSGESGISRLTGSLGDRAARRVFDEALSDAGADIRVDGVGNQFGLFNLTERDDAPLVMVGSHLDSQPEGGRFDGAVGVAAAAAIGRQLVGERSAGRRFDANFCAVNWTNEEGARFRPSLLGSGVFVGSNAVEFALSRVGDDGISLGEALAEVGYLGKGPPPPLPACYLELHVEQGSVLEDKGVSIGIVNRSWGASKMDVTFLGEQAHTGPTKMGERRDALLAAAYLVADIREVASQWPDLVHASVGRMLVTPNSSNVVPSKVDLSVEVRSANDLVLEQATARTSEAISTAALRAGVDFEIRSSSARLVRALPAEVCDLVEACAATLAIPAERIDTVAGHDALSFLGLCPTGLIFIPSVNGISHNAAEFTRDADLEAGLETCLLAARRLCHAGGSLERARIELGAIA